MTRRGGDENCLQIRTTTLGGLHQVGGGAGWIWGLSAFLSCVGCRRKEERKERNEGRIQRGEEERSAWADLQSKQSTSPASGSAERPLSGPIRQNGHVYFPTRVHFGTKSALVAKEARSARPKLPRSCLSVSSCDLFLAMLGKLFHLGLDALLLSALLAGIKRSTGLTCASLHTPRTLTTPRSVLPCLVSRTRTQEACSTPISNSVCTLSSSPPLQLTLLAQENTPLISPSSFSGSVPFRPAPPRPTNHSVPYRDRRRFNECDRGW